MAVKLTIDNYRALRHVRWAPSGVCALTGANGSGKTTLLSVFDFLKYVYERGIGAALEFSGGASGLKHEDASLEEVTRIKLEIGDLAWELGPVAGGHGVQMPVTETVWLGGLPLLVQQPGSDQVEVGSQLYQSSHESLLSRGPNLLPESFAVARPWLESIANFRLYQNLDLLMLRNAGSKISTDSYLHETGRNAFSVIRNWSAGLKVHRERWDFVRDGLRECFPELFDDIEFQVAGQTVAVQFFQPKRRSPVPAYWAPNGLLVGLLHLCAIASTPDGGVVAIDEPENALHPYAIQALVEIMKARAKTHDLTVLLSTHSPVLLNAFNADPGHVYVMEPWREELPIRLDLHDDPEWLAHYALGDLYVDQAYGAQHPPKQR